MHAIRRTLGVLVSSAVIASGAAAVASPAEASAPHATVALKTQRMDGPSLTSKDGGHNKQYGWYNKGQRLTLTCYTYGQKVKGAFSKYQPYASNGGWDNLWYKVSDGRYVADIDINTGSTKAVGSKCGNTKPSSSTGRYNKAIASKAKAVRDGSYGGQCLVWAEAIIKRAGGPSVYLPGGPANYQSAWKRYANQVSANSLQPGDIVQFYSSSKGPHTSVIISGSKISNATVKYSNKLVGGYGDERVHTASLQSQVNWFGSGTYKFWRIK